MKIQVAMSKFDFLLGEGVTADLQDHEKAMLFNIATERLMKDCFYNKRLKREVNDEPVYGWENNEFMIETWYPLLCTIQLKTDDEGQIKWEEINEKLGAEDCKVYDCNIGAYVSLGQEPLNWYHLNYVSRNGKPVKTVLDNDLLENENNCFTESTEDCPIRNYNKDCLQIYPKGIADIEIKLVRRPNTVCYDSDDLKSANNVDSELPDKTVCMIIDKMVELLALFKGQIPIS